MRCPRCQSHVMPGVQECFACGLDLTPKPEPVVTMPEFSRARVPGLLAQRRRITSTTNAISYRVASLRAPLIHFFSLRRLPPILVALEGMCFGLWFFRRRQLHAGLLILLCLLALVAAMVIEAVAHLSLINSPIWLAMIILMVAGTWAVRDHLRANDRFHGVRLAFMSVATAACCVFSIPLLAGLLFSLMFSDLQYVRFGWRINQRNVEITEGSRGLLRDVSFKNHEIKRGDLLLAWNAMYKVMALPGESIEVRDCMILVNRKELGPEFWPLNKDWDDQRCDVNIAERTLQQNEWATLVPQQYYVQATNRYARRWIIYTPQNTNGRWQRLEGIVWPPYEWRWFNERPH